MIRLQHHGKAASQQRLSICGHRDVVDTALLVAQMQRRNDRERPLQPIQVRLRRGDVTERSQHTFRRALSMPTPEQRRMRGNGLRAVFDRAEGTKAAAVS